MVQQRKLPSSIPIRFGASKLWTYMVALHTPQHRSGPKRQLLRRPRKKRQHYLCASMEINLMANYYSHRGKLLPLYSYGQKINLVEFCYTHTKLYQKTSVSFAPSTWEMYTSTTTATSSCNYMEDVHKYNYIDARQRQLVLDNAVRRPATSSRSRTNSSSTTSSTYLG
jgi:hypothetical protein